MLVARKTGNGGGSSIAEQILVASVAPANEIGRVYLNSANGTVNIYNGTAWKGIAFDGDSIKNQSAAAQTASFFISGTGQITGKLGVNRAATKRDLEIGGSTPTLRFYRSNGENAIFDWSLGSDERLYLVRRNASTDANDAIYAQYRENGATMIGGGDNNAVNKLGVAGGVAIGPTTYTSVAAPTRGLMVEGTTLIGRNSSTGFGKLQVEGDIESSVASKGLVLISPNGSRFRVTVNDAGQLLQTNITPL